MPKYKQSNLQKINQILHKYPSEFSKTSIGQLHCDLCHKLIKFDKMFHIESHRSSKKHISNKNLYIKHPQPKLIIDPKLNNEEIVKAFVYSNIPLYKLRNKHICSLFNKLGAPVPSETSARTYLDKISDLKLQEIICKLSDKKIFIIIDETEIKNNKLINVLAGDLKEPNISYFIETREEIKVTAQTITHIIDDIIKKLKINRENFLLLLSDAARYMSSAGKTLKVLYPSLQHVTCLLHLLHNCALRIKSYFCSVNYLISSIKSSIVKNRNRKEMFADIGYPPVPIITRWGSWLDACSYYSFHFNEVKEIVERFKDDGLIVKNAKDAVSAIHVRQELVKIQNCYGVLLDLIRRFELKTLNIKNGLSALCSVDFEEDPCDLKKYLDLRLTENDASKIGKLDENIDNIAPVDRVLLLNAQSTSIDVERSFSLMGNLLRKDRNFKPNNISKYMILYYNSIE